MNDINRDRRRFLGGAVATAAAGQFGMLAAADAQPASTVLPAIKPGANTSFAPLKQINAGVLNIGYAEAGPADGAPVILLHGWPYDIYSFVDVAPLLASAGYRVIVPFVRGYGTTLFLSNNTVRNGQPSAVASDTIALMDALRIEKAILAGFDWGARSVNIVSALWPERCKATVSVSGYLIGSQAAGKMPLPPNAEYEWWYQFYFATDRGQSGYDKYRREFSTHLATRVAEVAIRRCHVQSQRGGIRQPRSCGRRDSQLPLATWSGRRRGEIRRPRKAPCRIPGHHRSHHHA
jgi:pimeloyl-ACP methyl ester carboxylesterase